MTQHSSNDKEYLLVTEYFHPDTASTGQLMTDLAVGLQNRGLKMTVFTSQPNYHSGENEEQPRSSVHDGVQVNRIRAPQLRQSSFIRRGFNWIVFTLEVSFLLLVSKANHEREIVFVSNPPFLPIALWIVCLIRGWEYTYIIYDLYPDTAVEMGYFNQGGFIDRAWSILTARVLRAAKNVVVLGPVMRDRVAANSGNTFDSSKITIIHNWEKEDFIRPKPKSENWFAEEHGLVDTFTLLYSGNIGQYHDLKSIIKGVGKVADGNDVTLLIIGEGDQKDEIVNLAEKMGLRGDRVKFLPYQPLDDLPYSLTAGDISVVTVQEGMEGICVSSKLYTALAAGTPVLVVAQPNDDEAQIVKAFDAGINVKQKDSAAVADAVQSWLENPDLITEQGNNARELFEHYCTKEKSIDRYYELLSDTHNVSPDPMTQQIEATFR